MVDGSILLLDLDEMMLVSALGIKRLHVRKIMREIKKLENKCTKYTNDNSDTRNELIKSLKTEIDELKKKNNALQSQVNRKMAQESNKQQGKTKATKPSSSLL